MGVAGYIGSHMVLELIDVGEEVTVLDDLLTIPDAAHLVVDGDPDLLLTTI